MIWFPVEKLGGLGCVSCDVRGQFVPSKTSSFLVIILFFVLVRFEKRSITNLFDLTWKIVFIKSIPAPAYIAVALFANLLNIYGVQIDSWSSQVAFAAISTSRSFIAAFCGWSGFRSTHQLRSMSHGFYAAFCGACCFASTQQFAEHIWNDTCR